MSTQSRVGITSMAQYNAYFHQATLHPLVSVGDLGMADLSLFAPTDFGMYCVVLMDVDFGELVKCGTAIRYAAGTMFWLRPGQVVSMNLDYSVRPQGKMLVFHPDMIERSGLGRDFYMFDFFNHEVNDALTLTAAERGIILNCFANIRAELCGAQDYLSNHMLRLGIGTLLTYCKRFFERQYAERVPQTRGGLRPRLELLLENYLSSGSSAQQGQPTVAWCAEQFNLSPNYFGEVVKRELHITAQEFIQRKIVAVAEHLLRDTSMTVGEIAEELGFAYTTHFTRMFKRKTGTTPLRYRRFLTTASPTL